MFELLGMEDLIERVIKKLKDRPDLPEKPVSLCLAIMMQSKGDSKEFKDALDNVNHFLNEL